MILFLLLFSFFGNANFVLPTSLDKTERKRTLEVLGLGTSTKFLSNAYPLGGYSGLEVSLSIESINIQEISKFGSGSKNANEVFYPKFTIGKGIYNNSDIFIHFIPFNETTGLSEFGLSLRWSFYQADFFPLNFSILAHASSSNVNNQIIMRNLGSDLMMSMLVSNFSFFFGAGVVNSTGDFLKTHTLNNINEQEHVSSGHFQVGLSYNFEPIFIGASIDRYMDTVYNLKVGALF